MIYAWKLFRDKEEATQGVGSRSEIENTLHDYVLAGIAPMSWVLDDLQVHADINGTGYYEHVADVPHGWAITLTKVG